MDFVQVTCKNLREVHLHLLQAHHVMIQVQAIGLRSTPTILK